jgi:hypothetical protein
MFVPRKAGLRGAFSTNQQDAYGTALTTLTHAHPYDGSIFDFTCNKKTNADQVGKGHEHPTMVRNTTCTSGANLKFDGSSFIIGFLAAFGLGDVVTIQPDDVGAPNVYEHTCKEMKIDDPTVGRQLPVTTFVDQISTNWQYKYRDIMVKSFEFSGQLEQDIEASAELLGSGFFEKVAISMPALTGTSFISFSDLNIMYGASSLNAKIQSISFKQISEINEKHGYHPGSPTLNWITSNPPQCRGRAFVKKRSNELKMRVEAEDDSLHDDMLNNTETAVTITGIGDLIESTYYHKVEIIVPKAVIKVSKLGEQEDSFIYDLDFTNLYDETLEAPHKVVITNNIPSYLDFEA